MGLFVDSEALFWIARPQLMVCFLHFAEALQPFPNIAPHGKERLALRDSAPAAHCHDQVSLASMALMIPLDRYAGADTRLSSWIGVHQPIENKFQGRQYGSGGSRGLSGRCQVTNAERPHSYVSGRQKAVFRIFQHQTALGSGFQRFRRREKTVRGGFGIRDVLGADDCVKKIGKARQPQGFLNYAPGAGGGHRGSGGSGRCKSGGLVCYTLFSDIKIHSLFQF